jgi:site-specific recombinase XerD
VKLYKDDAIIDQSYFTKGIIMKNQKPETNLSELMSKLLTQLHSQNYSQSTLACYKSGLNKITRYMQSNDENNYTKEICSHFLQEWQQQNNPSSSWYNHVKTIIDRLNDILDEKPYVRMHSSKELIYPTVLRSHLDDYLSFMRKHGNKESTINVRRVYCTQFLCSLESQGLRSIGELLPIHIYDAFISTLSKEGFCEKIPFFLNYLYSQHILDKNYSTLVPRYATPQILPTVYTNEEIECLLNAVNQSTLIGKRDYAILMIASRLGLRASDICNLSFENIHYDTETIEIIQIKTGAIQVLPLLPQIKIALDSYLLERKALNGSQYIFLRNFAPFLPLSRSAIWSITNKYFNLSRVDTTSRKHGPHSLRSSFASSLITENVPYSVVQKILGHEDPNSTKHYAKIDVEHLRVYALEVPEPAGGFAQYLDRTGGIK